MNEGRTSGARVKLAADLAAFAARLGHDFRQPRFMTVGGDDARALGGEAHGHAATDTGGRAGDDGDLVLETHELLPGQRG